MPTYEYVCSKCNEHLEVFQSFRDEPLKKHPGCGGKLTKVFGSVGVVLKGSGFYKTDSRAASDADKSAAKSSEKSSEKTSEKKTSEKTPAASEAKKAPEVKSA